MGIDTLQHSSETVPFDPITNHQTKPTTEPLKPITKPNRTKNKPQNQINKH